MELDYLFQHPSMLLMRQARRRFLSDEVVLIADDVDLPLEGGDIWRHRRTRDVARKLHAWLFYYYLRPFKDVDDELIAKRLVELARAWRAIVEMPPSRIPMAYHDEATAQRTIALSCLLDDYAEHLDGEDEGIIRQVIEEGSGLLASQEFYSAGTNHGMYQDLALIVASRHLANGSRFHDLAMGRLAHYFSNAFTVDGIHQEQSPEYHILVSSHLRHFVDFLEPRDPEAANRLRGIWTKTETYATMSISPLGKLAPVSDGSNQPVVSSTYAHVYPSAEFAYARSQGALGSPPIVQQLIASESGVAIFREDWRDLHSLYLYFSAAYNSDYHKHSDDLSLYVVHRGLEILREAGANGYQMDDPYTQYAFSSFAHNTLIVNGQGLPRNDVQGKGQVGLSPAAAETGADFAVRGWNRRYPGVEHRRELTLAAGQDAKRLRVQDTVTSEEHQEYQILWHLGPDVHAELRDGSVHVADLRQRPMARMHLASDSIRDISLVRGQTEPSIQGWYFPTMGVAEPAQTLIVSFAGSSTELVTDISLF